MKNWLRRILIGTWAIPLLLAAILGTAFFGESVVRSIGRQLLEIIDWIWNGEITRNWHI